MDTLKRERAGTLSEPLLEAARAIKAWRRRSEARAAQLAPAHATRVRRRIDRHGAQAHELVESLSARPDPMVRVLLVIVPDGDVA